jgi:hypothetical protein
MTDDPTRTEPAYFGTPEQLLNALTEMQRRETRIQERAILCAALEALIDKPAAAPTLVAAMADRIEALTEKLAKAVEAKQLASDAGPCVCFACLEARALLAEIEGEKG